MTASSFGTSCTVIGAARYHSMTSLMSTCPSGLGAGVRFRDAMLQASDEEFGKVDFDGPPTIQAHDFSGDNYHGS
jgi:hypothetical protein